MNPRTGVYAIIMREHKILLVKQHKGPHRGKWDLPGGGLEVGETIEEALRRELEEEIGLSFDTMELFDNFTAATDWIDGEGHSCTFYQIGLVYVVEGFSFFEKPGEMEYAWLALEALALETISPFVASLKKESKIGSKEPQNRLKLGIKTASRGVVIISPKGWFRQK